MRRPLRKLLPLPVLAVLACSLVLPGAAQASAADVLYDCRQGNSVSGYSEGELKAALDDLVGGDDEYYGCRDAIAAARSAIAGDDDGSGGGGGIGGGGPNEPFGTGSVAPPATQVEQMADEADRSALSDSTRRGRGAPALEVGGARIAPGGFDQAAALGNDLPPALLLTLIALAALAAAGGLVLGRRHLPQVRRVALRLARR